MRKRLLLSTVLSCVAFTVFATALVAQASAPAATIKLSPNAALASPPSSVIVSVTYSCQPSAFTFGGVSVDQSQTVSPASGSRIDVFGFGYFQPICDDRSHRADIVVSTSFWSPGTFIAGKAAASAFVYSGVVYANTTAELTIK